jgi:hypothetical protein
LTIMFTVCHVVHFSSFQSTSLHLLSRLAVSGCKGFAGPKMRANRDNFFGSRPHRSQRQTCG